MLRLGRHGPLLVIGHWYWSFSGHAPPDGALVLDLEGEAPLAHMGGQVGLDGGRIEEIGGRIHRGHAQNVGHRAHDLFGAGGRPERVQDRARGPVQVGPVGIQQRPQILRGREVGPDIPVPAEARQPLQRGPVR